MTIDECITDREQVMFSARMMKQTKELLTADERADVLNAVNEVLEKFGLEVCGYEDIDGAFFNIQTWRK